jgi:hypothetical protein
LGGETRRACEVRNGEDLVFGVCRNETQNTKRQNDDTFITTTEIRT